MERILEPELMDDDAGAHAYAAADFSASNQRFVDSAVQGYRSSLQRIVDLGCGPGDIDIRLARAVPEGTITAIDGSAPMLDLARGAIGASGLDRRIRLVRALLPDLPFRAQTFDGVLSKDMLHHLPDPSALWREVARLGRRGAVVLVMDLIRPDTPEAADAIVASVTGDADATLRQDFFNSLRAAFSVEEVTAQLQAAGLSHLDVTRSGDRHLLVHGVLA